MKRLNLPHSHCPCPLKYLVHAKSRAGYQVPPCSIRPCTSSPDPIGQPAARQPAAAPARLPSCCPLRGRRSSEHRHAPVRPRHLFTSAQRVDPPWAYRRREGAAAAGPYQGFECHSQALSPRLRTCAGACTRHAAPVWALRRVSAPYQQHGAGTPCARPPRSASSPAHGERAGRHRRCGSSYLPQAMAQTLGAGAVESLICVMRRRKGRTFLQISDGQRATSSCPEAGFPSLSAHEIMSGFFSCSHYPFV